jgi:predicted metal-dependent phosphotriesterase family hydrolase
MTVRGPVVGERIGFTLPHEHLSCDPGQLHRREQAYDYSPEFPVIVDELESFRASGGSCVVDLTTSGQGRDPVWLRRLDASTDVHIVMGTGWYRGSFFPADAMIEQRSSEELAEELISEIDHGLPTTGIRPGIVGEIGADEGSMSAGEEKVHRAAAVAARSTGLSLVTHSLRTRVALEQLRIFQEEELDPARVVIGHADTTPDLGYLLELLQRGVNLSFDQLGLAGTPSVDEDRTEHLLAELMSRGHTDSILLSHDVCSNAQLRVNSGGGFTYLIERFIPRLRAQIGVTDSEVFQMTTLNPRRLLATSRT